MKTIKVSAVILIKDNQILMSTRPEGKMMAGYWEFPGGKLEAGESFENCAIRELNEELGIEILADDLELFEVVNHCYDEFNIEMNVYCCNNWNNEIKPQENQKYKWFSQNEIDYNEILPADIELVKKVWRKVC